MAQDVRVGDKVRVTYTYEGEVDRVTNSSFHIEDGFAHLLHDTLSTIEILERAKPKVGDKVETRGDILNLPVGSVVRRKHCSNAYTYRVDHGTGLLNPDGYQPDARRGEEAAGTIVYLPE